MNWIVRSFLKGLIILAPIVGTFYILYTTVTYVDGLLHIPIPGVGIGIAFIVITLIGILASNVVGRTLVGWIEELMKRLPIVTLLYSSLKDLMSAFMGDQKRFNQPVLVDLIVDKKVRVMGFITCQNFADPKLEGYVAVYLPQSYAIAGNLLLVPRERVHPLHVDGAQAMAFAVSGGVSGLKVSQESTLMLETPKQSVS